MDAITPYIDFKDVNGAAVRSLDTLVPELLPGGKRVAKNWVVCNPTREDTRASLSVSLETGKWHDFATKDKGKTFASLFAYIKATSFKEANYKLADRLGVKGSLGSTSLTGNVRPFVQKKSATVVTMVPSAAREAPSIFPSCTPPDRDGKPWFVVAGDEGCARGEAKMRGITAGGSQRLQTDIGADAGRVTPFRQ